MLVVMSLLALTACGSDDPGPRPDELDRQRIQACINGGGDAIFTSDQYGNAEFIICDMS